MKNLVGQKFYRLTPIKRIRNYNVNHKWTRTYYECICDCGNYVTVDGSKLINGHTKSCGCLRKEICKNPWARKGYGESLRNRIIGSYKRNAKNKNIFFDLSKEEMINLFQGNCFYCGCKPNRTITRQKSYGSFTYNGIDRLNNKNGYTKENCVSCCSFCNYTKNKTSFKNFIRWIRRVYRYTKHIKLK